MKVLKFGGTSVGKPERMHAVAKLITADPDAKIVVLSALSGTTNALVEISQSLSEGKKVQAKQQIDKLESHYRTFCEQLVSGKDGREKTKAIIDEHFEFLNIILKISFNEALNKDILAQGELLSTKLFCAYLEEAGINAVLLPALEFMSIDEFEEPEIPRMKVRLTALIEQQKGQTIFITQGYICRNAKGEIDNLKRGGSDYSASLIGAAIQASEVQIWTDIDGMHNNDPRVVKKTIPISHLTFDEASELAYFGAKILHPSTIVPAQKYNVPVRLKNTMDEKAPGTIISEKAASERAFKAIAAKDNITAIKIKSSRMLMAYGFLRRVFEVFEQHKTPIDMIATSEVAVSLTIDNQAHLSSIESELKKFGSIEVDQNQTIICIVGNRIMDKEGALNEVFSALGAIPVRMVSCGGSANNVSVLIDKQYKDKALNALNEGLFGLR